jgi:hypothetical protein
MTRLLVWLNELANHCAAVVLAPIGWLPGPVSATLIAVVTGMLMLLAFKYTSNQTAIKRTRSQIKANLLALSLFKESVWVGLRAQGRVLAHSGRLMLLSLVPLLLMSLPMVLLLSQLALWYQARPLRVGEDAVVSVHLRDEASGALDQIQLASDPALEATIGPVRVGSKGMVCWSIRATEAGQHELLVSVDDRQFAKQVAVGGGFMPTSLSRPRWQWTDVLLNPRESPFGPDSPVQSIDVAFPDRTSWSTGSDTWLLYWFAVSLAAAFAVRPLLKVNV